MRKPRVLMVVESSSGGTGRHVIDLCQGLAARGCEVHLLFSTGRVDRLFLERLGALEGVCCTPLPMRTSIHPSDLRAVWAVRRYLYEFGPFDVVHGHSSKGGAVARLAAVGTRADAFYTLHGLIMMDPGLGRLRRLFYQLIELALSLRTRHIIAVSPEERRAAVRLGLGRSRVVLVPNGVGPSELAPRHEARRAIGAGDGEFVIGFVGRFVSQKAADVLLRAMRPVAAALPGARLAMVGAGPLEAELRGLSEHVGVADKTRWLGERDARALMAGFDVFAMPSCKEGLPYVVLEAMSAGLPVVATDTAGAESLVEPGVNGAVVPCGDHARFATELIEIGRDPAKRRRYGAASLQRVSRFTIDAMVGRTLAAYTGMLVDEPSAPGSRAAPASAVLEECEALT